MIVPPVMLIVLLDVNYFGAFFRISHSRSQNI